MLNDTIILDCGIVGQGYHATTRNQARVIQQDGFQIGDSPTLHLGHGVYFWWRSLKHAKRWTKKDRKLRRGACIFEATINLGYCLDLTISEHIELLEAFERRRKKFGMPKVKMGVAINALAGKLRIDTVKQAYHQMRTAGVFLEGVEYTYTKCSVCVRNLDNIISYKLVVGDVKQRK